MSPLELLTAGSQVRSVYEGFCRPVCRQWGLSQTELDVLLFLANNPEADTARDVCRLRKIKKALVSVTVDKLASAGLLEKRRDPADRRIWRLALTPAALPAAEAGKRAQQAFFSAVCRDLTQEQVRTFFALQEIMVRAIQKLAEEEDGYGE